MNRDQLIRALRAYCRSHGLTFRYDPRKGKGSHGRVHIGERFTTVPAGELRKPTLEAILKQLGVPRDDIG